MFNTGLLINSVYLCTSFIATRHHPITLVTPTASVSFRGRLRSASSSRYEQPRMRLKFSQRCFSYAASAAWNTLPPSLQQLTNTDSFKRQLKTVLFELTFSLITLSLHFILFSELCFILILLLFLL